MSTSHELILAGRVVDSGYPVTELCRSTGCLIVCSKYVSEMALFFDFGLRCRVECFFFCGVFFVNTVGGVFRSSVLNSVGNFGFE